ncbi:tetratricopeptide repeat protein [Elusimicrobiota bacterium]
MSIYANYMMRCLIIIVMMSVLAGCGGDYNAEKMYWQIGREHKDVFKSPANASDMDFSSAIADLKNIVVAHPSWSRAPEIRYNIGKMYEQREDYEKARNEFREIVIGFPQNYEICARSRFMIGILYEKENNTEKAVESFNKVIERHQNTVIGVQMPLYIAQYYARKEMKEEAEREFKKAARKYKDMVEVNPYSKKVPLLHNLMVLSYMGQNRVDDIIDELEEFCKKNPETEGAPAALYTIAMIYRDIKADADKAELFWQRLSVEYSESKFAKNALLGIGGLSILQGNVDRAMEIFNDLREKYPDDKAGNARAMFSIAMSYEKEKNWEQALKLLNSIQVEYPDTIQSMMAPLSIASHYRREGIITKADLAFQEAIEKYNKIIAENPKKYIALLAHEYISKAYMLQEKWNETISRLNIIRQTYPGNIRTQSALLKIAVVYEAKIKDKEKASAAYSEFIREYPEHKLAERVKKKIKELSGKKNEDQ